MLDDILLDKFPTLDLHGEIVPVVALRVEEFIMDNYKLRSKTVVVIHGKGTGAVRKAVHDTLKKNKLIKEYRTSYFNDGCTIIKIEENNIS